MSLWPVLRDVRVALWSGWAAALVLASSAAGAIPRLDLTSYPQAPKGERRWVIQLPGVLPPAADPSMSPNPRDWRVQLIVGQMAEVDCNQTTFMARLRPWQTSDTRPMLFRVDQVGPLVSTRMACPPDQKRRQAFVPMGGKPYVVPYNASHPIVVMAPSGLQVRWRLWKAEGQSHDAMAL